MTITEARKFAGQSIGLSSTFDGSFAAASMLTQEQQIDLNRAMLNYILAHPGQFTAQQVSVAQSESGRALAPQGVYQDSDFSVTEFGEEVASNATDLIGAPLAAIGTSVSGTVRILALLIPVAAIGYLVLQALPLIKKAKA